MTLTTQSLSHQPKIISKLNKNLIQQIKRRQFCNKKASLLIKRLLKII